MLHAPPTIREQWPTPRVVYDRRFNIRAWGLQRFHPFDCEKYGRVWKLLRDELGPVLKGAHVRVPRAAAKQEIGTFHAERYLDSLHHANSIARIIEVQRLKKIPAPLLDWCILRPMRWATMGTIIAGREALGHGLTFNIAGGYHHASFDFGHGFNFYSDIGIALQELRTSNMLSPDSRIIYIDLDVHQGDGVCRIFKEDSQVFIYDQYNADLFPNDDAARLRIDCDVPLQSGCDDERYLHLLQAKLPEFLDAISKSQRPRLAIYNAGTDVHAADRLGMLQMSDAGVLHRDQFVIRQLVKRHIPVVMLSSGGYSDISYKLIASTIAWALKEFKSVDR